jgi:DNA-binding NarL/FixJ family response regulator
MVTIGKTSIFCFDDHKNFSDDIKKRFSDSSRYKVVQTTSRNDLLKFIKEEADTNSCKVAIIAIHDSKEHLEVADHLTVEIKDICPDIGIILLVQGDKIDDVKKAIRFNIESYIPRNDNSVLRIHNTIKKLISHRNLAINSKRRKISLYVLLAFILVSLIILIISYFRLPDFF